MSKSIDSWFGEAERDIFRVGKGGGDSDFLVNRNHK